VTTGSLNKPVRIEAPTRIDIDIAGVGRAMLELAR
jgi:2-keto-4-pentenoate hydratase